VVEFVDPGVFVFSWTLSLFSFTSFSSLVSTSATRRSSSAVISLTIVRLSSFWSALLTAAWLVAGLASFILGLGLGSLLFFLGFSGLLFGLVFFGRVFSLVNLLVIAHIFNLSQ
jgi:hypothetical protein